MFLSDSDSKAVAPILIRGKIICMALAGLFSGGLYPEATGNGALRRDTRYEGGPVDPYGVGPRMSGRGPVSQERRYRSRL